MAGWHFDQLRDALLSRGWRYVEQPSDYYQYPALWELRRSNDERVLILEFHSMDADGETRPLEESNGCSVRGQHRFYLDFDRKRARWRPALERFLDSLEP